MITIHVPEWLVWFFIAVITSGIILELADIYYRRKLMEVERRFNVYWDEYKRLQDERAKK